MEPTVERYSSASSERRDKMRQQGHAALQNENGERREHTAAPHRRGHDGNDNEIQHGLDGQRGIVPVDAVLNGAHDGHRADADRERGDHKRRGEMRIARVVRFPLQPFAQRRKPILDAQKLAHKCAEHETEHNEHGSPADDGAAVNGEHTLHRTGGADKQHADAAGLAERFLLFFLEKAPEKIAGKSADMTLPVLIRVPNPIILFSLRCSFNPPRSYHPDGENSIRWRRKCGNSGTGEESVFYILFFPPGGERKVLDIISKTR